MNINIYTTATIPHAGGMSTHIIDIMRTINESNDKAILYCHRANSKTIKSGGTSKSSLPITVMKLIYKIILAFIFRFKLNADMNIYHDPFSILFSKNSQKKVLYVHGELSNEFVALNLCSKNDFIYKILQMLEKYAYKKANLIICVDKRLTKYVKSHGFNSITMSNFVYIKSELTRPRKIDSKKNINIVIARRFVEKNGIEYALEACRQLVASGYKIKCDIFGTGQLFFKIKQRFPEKFFIYHGDVTPEIVRINLQNAHFSLVPSIIVGDYVEATSISTLEACIEGSVLIASGIGGINDLFYGTNCAVLVKPGSSEEIFHKIIDLINNPDEYNRLSADGQNFIYREYNQNSYYSKLKSILLAI